MHYASLSQHLETYLVIGAALFGLGLFGMAMRRTFIGMLIASELILCGASVNFMAFGRFSAADTATGQIAALFVMAIAAAEAVIVLSIIIAVYRLYRSVETDAPSDLKG